MTGVLLENVYKWYPGPGGGIEALRGISLQIESGEFVALWGPSGCGKSTLLHVIGAMDRPTRGAVWLAGERLDQLSAAERAAVRRRKVGFVFQSYHLLPTLTVWENAVLPLLLEGSHLNDARREARRWLEWVGLAERTDHYPSQLSGGEMQRVAVVRAIVHRPRVLLADEPTGSLDSANGRRILELLVELNRREGITVLLATHSPEAAAVAARILRMRDGQIDGIDVRDGVDHR